MTLEHKIGQMIMVGFRGLTVGEDSPIIREIREYHVGGVLLFDYDSALKSPQRNIHTPEQVAELNSALQEASETPLFIAIDQEGGRVNRLKECFGFPPTVSARYLGERNQPELTRRYAGRTAKVLADTGINLNLAPVLDLNVNPASPAIGKVERSFSRHAGRVAEHAGVWLSAHHDHHILCAVKHFPGHGSASHDTHLGFVDVTDSWTAEELLPYKTLIQQELCEMVMTAHIFHAGLDSEWPATLSHKILTGMLRQELGYTGVIISDDMQMKAISGRYPLETAVSQAITAGVDLLCFGNNLVYEEDIASRVIETITTLVITGKIPEERIERSCQRLLRLKENILQSQA